MCRETDNTREGGRRRSATNIYPPPNSPPCCALCLGIPVGNACALRALLRVSALVHSKVRTRTRRGSLPRGDRTLAGFLHYPRETPYENAEHVAKLKDRRGTPSQTRSGREVFRGRFSELWLVTWKSMCRFCRSRWRRLESYGTPMGGGTDETVCIIRFQIFSKNSSRKSSFPSAVRSCSR